jgi:sec-independent protein translocase protein TatA
MIFNNILLGILGTQEIIIILIIVLVLFGGRKIPELMRGLGKGIREFKDASNGVVNEEDKKKTEEDTTKKT